MTRMTAPPDMARPPAKNPRKHWVQIERAALEAWAGLMARKPTAARLASLLAAYVGRGNAVVISQSTLAKMLKVSERTVRRGIKDLVEEKWIEVRRIGRGKEAAYVLNDRVVWCDSRENLRLSTFSAVVVANYDEQQDTAELESGPLQRIPTVFAGETLSPAGPGLPPPSQPSLTGLEPVMYRDPVTGALFDLDTSTGELQHRLPVDPPTAPKTPAIAPESPPAEHPHRPLVNRIAGLLAASPDGITDRERVFLVEMAERLADGQPITAKQEAWAVAIVDREGGA